MMALLTSQGGSSAAPASPGAEHPGKLDPAPTEITSSLARFLAEAVEAPLRLPATPLWLSRPQVERPTEGTEPEIKLAEATALPGPSQQTGTPQWATYLSHSLHRSHRIWVLLTSRRSVTVVFLTSPVADMVPDFSRGSERDRGHLGSTRATRDAVSVGRDLHVGLRAIDDLRRWLSLTIADVARIAGLSESTVYWWAEHPTSIPRPAKVDRLLGLQALVWGLIEDLGEGAVRQWLRAGRPSPLDRLRRDPAALAKVEKDGYELLTRRARRRLAEAGPGRAVTADDDQRDLARLTEHERDLDEPLAARKLDPNRLEPEDLE